MIANWRRPSKDKCGQANPSGARSNGLQKRANRNEHPAHDPRSPAVSGHADRPSQPQAAHGRRPRPSSGSGGLCSVWATGCTTRRQIAALNPSPSSPRPQHDHHHPLVLLVQQCGGTIHTPGPTRAIRGMCFTFEQLEELAERLQLADGPNKTPSRSDASPKPIAGLGKDETQ